jgi:hypothetical protein
MGNVLVRIELIVARRPYISEAKGSQPLNQIWAKTDHNQGRKRHFRIITLSRILVDEPLIDFLSPAMMPGKLMTGPSYKIAGVGSTLLQEIF